MIKATVQKVENGFLVTDETGKVFIANIVSGYSGYSGHSLTEVLRTIFEQDNSKLDKANRVQQ